jgi:hypothetical protein
VFRTHPRHRSGLELQPSHDVLALRQLAAHELDGHRPLEIEVQSARNHSHPTLRDDLLDPVFSGDQITWLERSRRVWEPHT